jgi:putative oxidoreductase
VARIAKLLDQWAALLDWGRSPFLLLVRLVFGVQFAQSGWGKLHSLPDVTQFFTDLGIPMPGANAVVVATHEFVGGILIALGLGGRIVPVPLIFMMCVAYATSDIEAVQKSSLWNTDPFTSAAPFLFLLTFLLVLFFGPGAFSADELIKRAWGQPSGKKR